MGCCSVSNTNVILCFVCNYQLFHKFLQHKRQWTKRPALIRPLWVGDRRESCRLLKAPCWHCMQTVAERNWRKERINQSQYWLKRAEIWIFYPILIKSLELHTTSTGDWSIHSQLPTEYAPKWTQNDSLSNFQNEYIHYLVDDYDGI